jgi:hypothetical protein
LDGEQEQRGVECHRELRLDHEQQDENDREGRVNANASPADLTASDGQQVFVEAAAERVVGQQERFVPQLIDELDSATSFPLWY